MTIPVPFQEAFAAYRLNGDTIPFNRVKEIAKKIGLDDWQWAHIEEARWQQTKDRSATSRAWLELIKILRQDFNQVSPK